MRRNRRGKGVPLPKEGSPLEQDDSIVAAQIARGHGNAFEVLFEKYERTVIRIAQRLLRDDGEAEDVSQQVYMEAYRDIRNFDPRKGSFKAWLLRRALHRSINRRKQLETEVCYRPATNLEGHITEPATAGIITRFNLLPSELSCLTTELLVALSPDDRQVIIATFYLCLTREEAATQLGMTLSAIRNSQKRALKTMYSILVKAGDTPNGTPKESQVG